MNWAEIIKKLVPVIVDIIAPLLKGKESEIANAIILTEHTRGLSSVEKLDHAIDKVNSDREGDLEKVINQVVETTNRLNEA